MDMSAKEDVLSSEDRYEFLNYTHFGDTIFPLKKTADYTYSFVKLNNDGKITDSKSDFNFHLEQIDSDDPFVYRFSMLDQRIGNIILWKGNGTDPDSMGIYLIGTYDTTQDKETFFNDTIFWLPQNPQKEVRPITSSQTIEFLGDNFDFVITPESGPEVIIDDAMLFEERYKNEITYYYLKKGVGLIGWEMYLDSTLTDLGVLTSMNYKRNYDE